MAYQSPWDATQKGRDAVWDCVYALLYPKISPFKAKNPAPGLVYDVCVCGQWDGKGGNGYGGLTLTSEVETHKCMSVCALYVHCMYTVHIDVHVHPILFYSVSVACTYALYQ